MFESNPLSLSFSAKARSAKALGLASLFCLSVAVPLSAETRAAQSPARILAPVADNALDAAVTEKDSESPWDVDTETYLRSLPASDVPAEILLDAEKLKTFVAPEVRREQMAVTFSEHFQREGFTYRAFDDCPVAWSDLELPSSTKTQWVLDSDLQGSPAAVTACWLDALDAVAQADQAFLMLDVEMSLSLSKQGRSSVVDLKTSHATLPMGRSSELSVDAPRDRQLIVVGGRCDTEACERLLTLETRGGDVDLDVRVIGAFVRPVAGLEKGLETSSASGSKSGPFINGEFDDATGAGWQWRRYDATVCSPGTLLSSADQVATPLGGDNYAALLGGYGHSTSATPNVATMSQTVNVPFASYLDFDRNLVAGKNWLGFYADGQIGLKIKARNMTTGVTSTIYNETFFPSLSNDSTGWGGKRVNVGSYGGHSVAFTFTACDPFHDGSGDRKGSARVDSPRFSPKPINRTAKPTTGLWYDPSKNGQGIDIQKSPVGSYLVTWYTYEASGQPVWYISDTSYVGNGVWTAPLFRSTWNPATQSNSLTTVGDLRFEMFDSKTLRFYWDFHYNGTAGWDGSAYYTHLFGGASATGMWYEPSASGWGLTVANQNSSNGPDTVVTVFLYQGTQPVWVQGVREGTPSDGGSISMLSFVGSNLCPSCSGIPSYVSYNAGTINLNLGSSFGTGSTDITMPSGSTWDRLGLSLARLTVP